MSHPARSRCLWAKAPLDIVYHDHEWGVPVHDDRTLFEFLTLEGAQAGLSWSTILKKRAHYRQVFDDFEIAKVAAYDQAKVDSLLVDAGIVRNRLKVASTIGNARIALEIQAQYGSLNQYLWDFVGGEPVHNAWSDVSQVPAKTLVSDQMSKTLIKRGFKFVGSTICYAFMQATGMVNDHTIDCFRHAEISARA